MKAILAAIFALALSACATTVDFTQTKLAVATHADLQAAAAYATTNGYPQRAAWWTAIDQLLTAQEAQANACEAAIQASLPKAPALPAGGGVALAVEAAAEAVGNFSGVPARVKILCEPLPIPTLPVLPKP